MLLFERICFCSFSRVEGNEAHSDPPPFECNKRHSELLSRASLSIGRQWNGFEVGTVLRMKPYRYKSNLLIVLFWWVERKKPYCLLFCAITVTQKHIAYGWKWCIVSTIGLDFILFNTFYISRHDIITYFDILNLWFVFHMWVDLLSWKLCFVSCPV